MKRLLFIITVLIIPAVLFAQKTIYEKNHPGPPREKLEQLERLKLLETLDLDEETSVRFFTRRSEHKDEIHSIIERKEKLVEEMENALDKDISPEEYNYREKINELINLEKEILKSRENFINSLNDILSEEQIAEVLVFESRFIKEIRGTLIRMRKGRD